MTFFLISVLAGVLTVLAPCILPLLPIVIGTSAENEKRHISRRSLVVISSLSVSVFLFTLLLKASTIFISVPQSLWAYLSGTIIIIMGLLLLFPSLLSKIPLVTQVQHSSNKLIGTGYQKHNALGDSLIGLALGPVFSTCSPTYLFIIATVLPASLGIGITYLIGFIIGLVVSLLLIAYFGQQLINLVVARMGTAEMVKQLFAGLIILVGIAIFTGYDKKIESYILDSGYGASIDFENELIQRFNPVSQTLKNQFNISEDTLVSIPQHLQSAFPKTDWSNVSSKISGAISGGPGRDGIPAIDNPVFEPISEYSRNGDVPAIFIDSNEQVKVYPYNILNWHEIVNDTVDGIPVSITFCPLCGSAVVYKRVINGKETTLGVSGSLLESNMIMYDRNSETLWQQSTGKALAGEHFGTTLELVSMHLSTVGEIQTKYPNAIILSEETGFPRQYDRDPYAGYTSNETFIFNPSKLNQTYSAKEVFLVFRTTSGIVAVRQSTFPEAQTKTISSGAETYTIKKTDNNYSITNISGEVVPFYFEMWFSLALQNGQNIIVVE